MYRKSIVSRLIRDNRMGENGEFLIVYFHVSKILKRKLNKSNTFISSRLDGQNASMPMMNDEDISKVWHQQQQHKFMVWSNWYRMCVFVLCEP